MRKTKEDTEITRSILIQAGFTVFCEKGYAATRLEDIADTAGMTRGAIYWHFQNKLEFYEYLLSHAVGIIEDIITISIKSKLTFMEKIQRILMETQANSRELRLIQGVEHSRNGLNNEQIEIAVKMQEKMVRIQNLAVTALEEAKSKGEIHSSVSSEDIIRVIFIFMKGLNSPAYYDKTFLSKDNSERLINIFFLGLKSVINNQSDLK